MITSIGQSIDALKEEYGLDRELVIEAMTDAVRAAARKQFKSEYKAGEGIQVDWNDDEGIVEISAQKTIVEEVESPTTELSLNEAMELTGDDELELGDMLLLPLPTEDLGRIAAQTAKQILVQKIREAVRERVYEEFIDRKGELINGLVKRFERGDMIVDLGTNLEAVLPRREQTRGEAWNINERIRVVIVEVSKELRGQQIVVSRASAELLKRLFEMEVPEIYDETVVIKSAVREPGDRAKIAVSSNEKDVDPVGACVGMKGSRVQSIIKELRGEKIDIIEWSDEPSVFAANALSPAKVSQVRITDINERKMEVIVTEDQLSLAIGRRGQNVRLATRLVGWDIDIVSEELLKQEITRKMGEMMASGEAVPVSALDGVTPLHAQALEEGGISDIEKLAATSVDDIVEVLDISLDEAESVLESARQVLLMNEAPADEPAADETEGSDSEGAEEKTAAAAESAAEEDSAVEDKTEGSDSEGAEEETAAAESDAEEDAAVADKTEGSDSEGAEEETAAAEGDAEEDAAVADKTKGSDLEGAEEKTAAAAESAAEEDSAADSRSAESAEVEEEVAVEPSPDAAVEETEKEDTVDLSGVLEETPEVAAAAEADPGIAEPVSEPAGAEGETAGSAEGETPSEETGDETANPGDEKSSEE